MLTRQKSLIHHVAIGHHCCYFNYGIFYGNRSYVNCGFGYNETYHNADHECGRCDVKPSLGSRWL